MIQPGAGSAWRSLDRTAGRLTIVWVRGLRRGIEFCESAAPSIDRGIAWGALGGRGCRISPLRTGRTNGSAGLVRLGMDILRQGSGGLCRATLAAAQQLEASLDMDVGWVELCCALICIQGIVDLIIT